MATRKSPSPKSKASSPLEEMGESAAEGDAVLSEVVDAKTAASLESDGMGDKPPFEEGTGGLMDRLPDPAEVKPDVPQDSDAVEPENGHPPRFHFFVIDAGWKTEPSKVLRDNFHMIRLFQNNDPLYILNREQSIALIRANPDLIGKDPILLVHDLHAQGGRGESGYHGFRLCLGLINNPQQALAALQKFLRFVQQHRGSEDIEKHIRDKLHRKGLENAIEVMRESIAA